MSAMTAIEQQISDIALNALAADPDKGYVLTSEGRDALIAFLRGLRSDKDRKAAAEEMLRVAHFIHSKMKCASAATELLNVFAEVAVKRPPSASDDERRKASARAFLGSTRREATVRQSASAGATTAWWNLQKAVNQ